MRLRFRFGTLGWILTGLFVILAAATVGTFFVTHHFMHEGFEEYSHLQMNTSRRMVDDYVRIAKESMRKELRLISKMEEIRDAFATKNKEQMRRIAIDIMEQSHATFATLTDPEGNVLARALSDSSGDNIANTELMKSALLGEYSVDIVRLKNNGLSIAAAAPVYDKGKIVGGILFGNALKTNVFVNDIKRVTSLEMTVFDETVRIATTLTRDGRRATGTKIENADIASRVLGNAETFTADAPILGKSYKTIYWPVCNNAGDVLGMWFLGVETASFDAMVNKISFSCLLGTICIGVALGISGAAFFRSLIAPLRNKAFTDGLTGILNRAGIERYFNRNFDAAHKRGTFFLMDLDHFKEVNDILGHPVGDTLLRDMADILQKVFRESDIIARLGGDEFAVYSPTLESQDVIELKCRSVLREISREISLEDGKVIRISASIGVALCPRDGEDLESLYKSADMAIFR